jgi:hypothetical protein
MEAPPRRSSNVAGALLAGVYRYLEPGAEPVLVDVTYELGEPVARVLDPLDEDAGAEFDPRCVTGRFDRVNGSQPPG